MGGVYLQETPKFHKAGLPGLSRTLKASMADAGVCVETTNDKDMAKVYKIRKMTPRECFRLMGVTDADVDKIQAAGISESQQYKMAGNSIVVQVLEGIFTQMFRVDDTSLF